MAINESECLKWSKGYVDSELRLQAIAILTNNDPDTEIQRANMEELDTLIEGIKSNIEQGLG